MRPLPLYYYYMCRELLPSFGNKIIASNSRLFMNSVMTADVMWSIIVIFNYFSHTDCNEIHCRLHCFKIIIRTFDGFGLSSCM